MNILYVEDEQNIAHAIAALLKKNNYTVDLAYDGNMGLEFAQTGIYDVILLDIMLPYRSGLDILHELRIHGDQTPIILLTARADVEDRIHGLDCGADDYLAKPFQPEELLARIRALSRRMGIMEHDNIVRFGDLELHPGTLELSCNQTSFRLTLKESQLLTLLIRNQQTVVPLNTIIEKLWGFETETEDQHVRVHMAFLRKKLRLLRSQVEIITIRGVGYTITQ